MRQSECGLGIDEVGLDAHDPLQLLPGLERPPDFEQHPGEPVAKVVKVGPQLHRAAILASMPHGARRLGVGVAQRGVLVGELGGDWPENRSSRTCIRAAARWNGRVGLGRPAQLARMTPRWTGASM